MYRRCSRAQSGRSRVGARSARGYASPVASRILGVNGSIRAGSTADRALQLALAALEGAGAQCETFDVGCLPLLDGRPEERYPPTVSAWRAAVEAADGFVLTIPTFHGSMPGALKNALDFLDVPQAGGKPFALIGVARGDAEPGVTDITRVLRHIGAVAAVPDVVISRSTDHWGTGPEPDNTGVAVAIRKVADDLLNLCALSSEGKLPRP